MTARPGSRRRVEQRGGVLLLFPAAVLVVVVLAVITVDSTIVFLGQRELANAVAAAANDAATVGVGNSAFYRGGSVQLDAGTARQVAVDRVSAALDAGRFRDLRVNVVVLPGSAGGCSPTVRVDAAATVGYLFARALPGGSGRAAVRASSSASPVQEGESGC